MTASLTGVEVRDGYTQLLFINGGLSATRNAVLSGNGAASALLLGTDNASVDNILLDGNTISTLDTNGNLILAPNGTGYVGIANALITGGAISGLNTPLPVASGGTGGATQAAARTGLGLLDMATQAASAVAITGGTVAGLTSLLSAYIRSTGSLGFTVGAGGAVTQGTSKSTGVTLNTNTGAITMHNALLNGNTSVAFTLTNSEIAATDVVVVSIKSGGTAASYVCFVDAVAAGSCSIHVRNVSGGALGEALVLNFVVVKGSAT